MMTDAVAKKDYKKLCLNLYIAYAASSVLQFSELTLLAGLIILIAAYIMCEIKKWDAKDTPYASHMRWMSRTFWIGTGVIMPIAVVIATVLILKLTNISSITSAMKGDDPEAIMTGIQIYMEQNMKKVGLITTLTMAPTVIWWLRRCWVGYKLAKDGKPVENVMSWL